MRIVAVGDIHGEEHLDALRASLAEAPVADLVLLAGDITHRNDIDLYGRVLEVFEEALGAPIIAVFGNHEWSDSHAEYRMAYPITFLAEEAKELRVADRSIRVVGSTGVLDRPTWWQRTNLPQIASEYTRRLQALDGLLEEEGFRILLTHYAPTYRTLVGEGESYWDQLGSKRMEGVLLRHRPELVVHGHTHRGVPFAELQTGQTTLQNFDRGRAIPIHNVSFPVRRDVTVLDL
ncbi:MAG: metallophosphoesterase [Candidatus Thermoplasmatota archaeon]|nr:metallophosphoesterase [Candidatus Thermoplasmatota archaeon]